MQKVRNLNLKQVATPSRNAPRSSAVNVSVADWQQASVEKRCRVCDQEVLKYVAQHLKLYRCIDIDNKVPVCDQVPQPGGGAAKQQDPWANWPGWKQQTQDDQRAQVKQGQQAVPWNTIEID